MRRSKRKRIYRAKYPKRVSVSDLLEPITEDALLASGASPFHVPAILALHATITRAVKSTFLDMAST